jgi:hypothetical protein
LHFQEINVMSYLIQRRGVLRLGLSLSGALLAPAGWACEFYTPRLRVTHPWTRATGQDGHAIVNMKFDEVTQADRLIRVETPVAEAAEMGGVGAAPGIDFWIPAGQETLLSESGTFIRLVGLKQPLEIARTYPLRLVFEHGGTVDADLSVDYEHEPRHT